MAAIPDSINDVVVEFADGVINDVDQALVDALFTCISPGVAGGYVLRDGPILKKIYVSAVSDHHDNPDQKNSRHNQKKAVDISRINEKKIAVGYPNISETRSIVDAIQRTFESCKGRRENFGPSLKKKLGQSWKVKGHHDHIHLSVN